MKQSLLSHDGQGCGMLKLITLLTFLTFTQMAFGQLSASVSSVTDVNCNGGNSGAIDINVSGGVPPYTFNWSNGATTEDVTGLTAGNYSVNITDANLNNINLDTAVSEPAALSATKVVKDVTCNAGTDGWINVSVSGGVPPYSYSWSNGDTTQDITNQPSGSYSVTITDANSCSLMLLDTIGEPSEFIIISSTATPVSCHGGSDGEANLTVVGGILPYTFVWSNGGTTKDLTGIPAGTYNVTASDNNGCKDYATVVVTEPAQAMSTTLNVTNSTCFLSTDGAIDLAVSGGTPPYTYVWSNGDTTQDLTGIGAGNYSVTITDDNGCTLVENPVVQADDTTPPVAQCQNINAYLDAIGNASITAAEVDNGSSDNCSIDTILLETYNFTCADLGANSVEVYVFDSNGNIDTCVTNVQVLDTLGPILNLQSVTVYLDGTGNLSVSANNFDNGSLDACGIDTLILDRYNYSCADIGTLPVQFTATDINGNSTIGTADLTVRDTIDPVAQAQNITVYLGANGMASITAAQVDNGSNDECGIDTLVLDRYEFDCSDVGVQSVDLVAVDNDGNIDVASANVTVADTTGPNITANDITVYLDVTGNVSITAADVVISATDSCGLDTIILDRYNFTCADVGVNPVQITATDLNSNASVTGANVTVVNDNPPAVSANDITIYLDASGNASITKADIEDQITTTCGLDTSYLDIYDFTCADVGINEVALIAEGNNGVIATDTAQVTVVDSISPNVGPQNISVYLDAAGQASITAAQVDNGSTDACGIDTLILNQYNFGCPESGSNTVQLTAIDANGNSASASATVDVIDSVAPVVSAQNITVYLDVMGQASIVANDVVNSATDNCAVDNLSIDQNSFDCDDLGANPVVLTAEDASGNSALAQATVTVMDTINPTVMAQDITVYLDGSGNISVAAADVDAGSATACGIDTLYLDQSSFTCADVGPNTVVLTAVKSNGQQKSDTAVVTVQDTIAPALNATNITVYLNSGGDASIEVSDIDNSISDACGLDTTYLDNYSFNCGNVGTNNIQLTAMDVNGNMATASAVITVEDTTSPDFVADNITIYLDASGSASITPADVSTLPSDACGILFTTLSQSTFGCAESGTNIVNVTALDVNGNSTVKQSVVTVVDSVDPVVTTNSFDLYLDANGQGTLAPADVMASASDACGIANMTLDITNFSCAELGANTIVLTVEDPYGNSASASATVNVYDTVSPQLSSSNVDLYLDTAGTVSIHDLNVNLYLQEACGLDTLYFSKEDFNCADLGVNMVGITAIDNSGNRRDDSLSVTVRDTTPPNLVNQNLTIYLDATGNASITTADVNQLSSDVCGIDTLYLDQYNFNCSNVGANTVTITGVDLNGTMASAPATVTVVDTILPFAKANNLTVYLDSNGLVTISPADVDNGSVDGNCSYSLSLTDSIFDCSELGLNLESLTITDGGGNSGSVDFFITVLDTMSPQLSLRNMTVVLDENGQASVGNANQYDNGSTDNCTNMLYFTASKTNFTCSDIGVNWVSVTAVDNKLNSSTDSVMVTVVDGGAPSVATQNVTAYLDASGNAVVNAQDVDNGSTDDCGLDSLWLSKSKFKGTDLGANSITFYAQDFGGNITTGNSIVTIVDTVKPVIGAQNINLYLDGSGQANFNGSALGLAATDNHGIASLNAGQASFACADTGINPVSVTAVDSSGNSSTAPVNINVMDTIAPTVMTKNIALYLDATGSASLNVADVDANSYDNCGINSRVLSRTSFSCADVGNLSANLTIEDAQGNSKSQAFNITVIDTFAPSLINVPADTVIPAKPATCGATVWFATPATSDNCSNSNFSSSHSPGTFFPVGTTKVSFSVQDVGGNIDSASFTITVVDDTPPVITSMPSTDTVGACQSFYNFSMPVASDNCSNATVTQIGGIPSGGYYPTGTTVNSFKVTDGSGNDTIVNFSVVVEPLGQPSLPNTLTICENDDPVDFSQGQNMQWSGKGMVNSNTFDPAAAGSGRHMLNYNFVDKNGCVSTGSISITVASKPTQPVVNRIGSNTLSTGAYDTYQWYRDGKEIPGANKQTYSYTTGGNYQVMVTNTASCSNYSSAYVVGSSGGGIGLDEEALSSLSVYPNPSNGILTIDLNNWSKEELEISLFSITGRQVFEHKDFTQTNGKMQLNLADLPKATYVLHVNSGSQVEVRQIVLY